MSDYIDSSWDYGPDNDLPEDYRETRNMCDGCGLYFYVSDLTRINGQLICEACQLEEDEP